MSQQQFDAAVAAADAQKAAADTARAQIAEAEAGIRMAESRQAQATAGEQQARAALQGAQTAPEQVTAMRARASSAQARVEQAKATLAQAELNLAYTVVKAPARGHRVEEERQPGSGRPARPAADGARADRRRVDHRELQGDAAREHAPGPARHGRCRCVSAARTFTGHVDSIAAATGARFSLLPPENATGNFVKVVQRVPVKIVLEAGPGSGASPAARHVGHADGVYEIESSDQLRLAASRIAMTEHRYINPWLIAVSVMFATFMEVLDTTVVNVSLPHIAGSLSASIDEATWALTSYLVANAIILPMTGWLASMFGRKRLLMLSVVGFTAASFLAVSRRRSASLIFFRILQGATGGALQPLSQAVLLEAFPPHDRGKAMGFWGLGIVVAPILGPVLGGWLTDTYSWRWVFYINIPVGIASIVMTQALHLRSAVSAQPNRAASTTGASACWRSASARCRSCSTRDSRKTGSRRR